MSLATLLHISDLHFSDEKVIVPDPPSGIFSLRAYFDGLLGHSSGSLIRLYHFWETHFEDEDPLLVVTGDLTRVGKTTQFVMANDYLASTLTPPIADYLGLKAKNWKDCSIPGNHDHWPGLPIIVGPPRRGLKQHFGHVPCIANQTVNLQKGRKLKLFLIDSDADVANEGLSRILAIGAFESELKKLDEELGSGQPDGSEVRVLCLHHSPAHTKSKCGISKASRKTLDKFIARHDIAVILTGHVHDPLLKRSAYATKTGEVLEARCGTSTQASNPPKLRRQVNPWSNSLLVHRLIDKGSSIHWQSEVYFEDKTADPVTGEGFKKSELLEKSRREDDFKVWPRP